MSSTMHLNTEIRKLRPAELYTLGNILSISDAWKKLMAIVPQEENVLKFNSGHVNMIEQAACEYKRNAAEIFLDEWSTMGKKRPTLETLLDLLIKAELFRAADYVACYILKQEKPKRPDYGPAASIDISDAAIDKLLEEQQIIPKIIDTNSLLSGYSSEEINKMYTDNKTVAEKTLVLHEAVNENLPLAAGNILNCEKSTDIILPEIISDLMKFSVTDNCKISTSEQQLSRSVNIEKETSSSKNLSDNYTYHEMSSEELPVFLNNPVQSVTIQNVEMASSGYLPVFLNNPVLSATEKIANEEIPSITSEETITSEEMASSDLPVCLKQGLSNDV